MPWAAAAAVAGAALSYKGSKDSAKAATANNQAQIEANQVDPRITNMLFGSGTKTLKPGVEAKWSHLFGMGGADSQTMTNPESDYSTDSGLLGRYTGMLDTPQSHGMKQYGQANDNYAGNFAAGDLEAARAGAMGLLAGNKAPAMQAASSQGAMSGTARVNAPAQNSLDLTGSYKSLIDGDPGANPFLTGAIGKGINQSNNAFGAMQRDSTKNLLENIMPSIRGGARVSGSYGSNREALAQGKALEGFATEQQRAMSQFGQNATDAAVSAQAGAYDTDMNRRLAATTQLSGQQYGVAGQNASLAQQSMLANADRQQQSGQFNAGLLQDAAKASMGSQLTTNAQNAQNTQTGIGAIGGLLTQTAQAAGTQDQYDLNKMINVNQGLLQPYLNKNATPTQLMPVYNNSGASAVGGAMAGLGIANQISGMFKGSDSPKWGSTGATNTNMWLN